MTKDIIPSGWIKVRLGNLLNYEQPYKYEVVSEEYKESGIPVLTAGKSFILGYSDEETGIYDKGNVIIFDDFTTDSKYVTFPFKVKSSAMKFLTLKNENENSLLLIYNYLQLFKLREVKEHKRQWLGEFSKYTFYLPSTKKEQEKIASILLKINTAIEQTQSLINKYSNIKKGLMHDLLTYGIDEKGQIRSEKTHRFKDSPLGRIPKEWEIKTIGEITTKVGSGITPTGGSEIYLSEGVLFIRSQNVYPYGFKLDDVVYISEKVNESMRRSQLQKFDVLLNITGASIGRSTYVPENFPCANVNQHVCIIRLEKPSLEKAIFLSTFLNSDFGQMQIDQSNAGSNREGLNYEQVKKIIFPLFTNDKEYINFVETMNKVNMVIDSEQKTLEKLFSQKQGLMSDLLTGKIRVKVE